jgi:hypothetical protein
LCAQFPSGAADERTTTNYSLFPKDMVDLAAYALVLQHLGEIVAYLRRYSDARPGAPRLLLRKPLETLKSDREFHIRRGIQPSHIKGLGQPERRFQRRNVPFGAKNREFHVAEQGETAPNATFAPFAHSS